MGLRKAYTQERVGMWHEEGEGNLERVSLYKQKTVKRQQFHIHSLRYTLIEVDLYKIYDLT